MNPPLRAPKSQDSDLFTLGAWWRWIKGAFIVVAGSIVVGFVGLFTGSWVPRWSLPSWMAGVDCLDCVDYAI
jgi:hypothetical protein